MFGVSVEGPLVACSRKDARSAVTRELKLGLILGVTLVLGVAVAISDHLAVNRRQPRDTQVALQPALAPPPVREAPPVPESAQSESGRVSEPQDRAFAAGGNTDESQGEIPVPAIIAQRTKVSRNSEVATDDALMRDILAMGGTIENGEIRLPLNAARKPILPPAANVVTNEEDSLASRLQSPSGGSRWAVSEVDFSDSSPTGSSKSNTLTSKSVPPRLSSSTERTYTVAQGDSAFLLAKRFLGNGSEWKKLRDANPSAFGPQGQVKVGTRIVIPDVEVATQNTKSSTPTTPSGTAPKTTPRANPTKPGTTKYAQGDVQEKPQAQAKTVPAMMRVNREADAPAALKTETYTVRPGDTLTGIALKQLGSRSRTDEILTLNRGVIKNPDELPQGLAIRLPVEK